MKLIIGLGNPGSNYNFTRHNAGFLALDFYFKVKKYEWNEKLKFGAIYRKVDDAIFIKPQEFYNKTGEVAREFMRYYKIPESDILVVCDNFDLEFGKTRFKSSGLAGGNNGLKPIDKALETSEYPRLRIGTENNELRRKMGDIDFVLSKFTPEEKELLPKVLSEVAEKIDEFLN